jgi:hypothetical protein
MKNLSGVRNLAELSKDSPRGKAEWFKLKRILKNVRVRAVYMVPQRIYKIENLALEGSKYEFELQDGSRLTVEVCNLSN